MVIAICCGQHLREAGIGALAKEIYKAPLECSTDRTMVWVQAEKISSDDVDLLKQTCFPAPWVDWPNEAIEWSFAMLYMYLAIDISRAL